MTSDATVLIFKSICNFIKDLNESFGEKQKSLLLYAALIEKTGLMHEEPIKKHISIFSEFCKQNEEAIMARHHGELVLSEIRYSDKVYIDVAQVFELADSEEKEIVWSHFVALLALLHPSSEAKKLLKKQADEKRSTGGASGGGNEEEFLSSLVDKVGKHIDPTVSNPMDMMNGIMSSGVFQELVGSMNTGISEGNLDIGKMLGSLQSMIGNINTARE